MFVINAMERNEANRDIETSKEVEGKIFLRKCRRSSCPVVGTSVAKLE